MPPQGLGSTGASSVNRHGRARMATQADPPQSTVQQRNVFDSAKAIVDVLAGIQKNDQERVLRWVAESLGIQFGVPTPPPSHHATPHLTVAGPPQPTPPVRAQDIRSFVQAKQPKSDMQFAAVVAYFYRFEAPTEQRRDSINSDCLQEATRLSGRDRLGNPNATLNNAVAQGYLDRADRGEFTISTVGENLVAMTLPGTGDNGGSGSRARSTRKRASKKAAKKKAK